MGYKGLAFPCGSVFLVTGGAGFIGANLCEAILKMGFYVRCLDDFSNGKWENIADFVGHDRFALKKGDIRDMETCKCACADVDYVLHQAAWGSVPRSIKMPQLYEDINVKGTLNMLEAARHSGVKKFVYASSSSVYGDSAALPKKEGAEGKPLSPYAVTKRANEEYAALYTRLYGLETYGLRYFNVFGRKQDASSGYAAAIPKFISGLQKGVPPVIYGDGTQSRDFTYIENVIEANLRACLASPENAGEVFNIACGGRVTVLSMYEDVCKLLGKYTAPSFAAERCGDIQHSCADISKARALLGYAPEYDFARGIALCVKWYQECEGCDAP